MNPIAKRLSLSAILFFCICCAQAQTSTVQDTAYLRTITQRADKIVATLAVNDDRKAIYIRDIIRQQYQHLKDIHDKRDEQLKLAKAEKKPAEELAQIQSETDVSLAKLHQAYIASLSKYLNEEQVEKVKDGMTYNILPITYKGYLEMIPVLTEDQKKQIKTYLIEAREHAMDAGSSEEKHKWFGKYKGRINNYLSAAGYNLKKEGEEWERRRKEAADKGK